MQFSYRGQPYQSEEPTLELSENQLPGKYRGVPIQVGVANHQGVPQSVALLRYRGVPYIRFR